jgi:hypothetical protein
MGKLERLASRLAGKPAEIEDLVEVFAKWAGVQSGSHLAAVRRWIKWNFTNGDRVAYGSETSLRGKISAKDLERLAQEIRQESVVISWPHSGV